MKKKGESYFFTSSNISQLEVDLAAFSTPDWQIKARTKRPSQHYTERLYGRSLPYGVVMHSKLDDKIP